VSGSDDETWLPGTGAGQRRVTAAEFAAILHVTEQDVLDWIAEGKLPSEPGPDGEPRMDVMEEHFGSSEDGAAITGGFFYYSAGSVTGEEIAARRRVRQLESYGYDDYAGPIDIEALVVALSRRLAAVVPDPALAEPYLGKVYGTDVAAWVAGSADQPPEALIPVIAARVMETTSEDLADDTTEPWPARGGQFPGGFAPIGAEIADGVMRMYWGEAGAPILELEPLPLAEVLRAPA
jgi:hypothetical protein